MYALRKSLINPALLLLEQIYSYLETGRPTNTYIIVSSENEVKICIQISDEPTRNEIRNKGKRNVK